MRVKVKIDFLPTDETFVFREDSTGDMLYFGISAMERFAKKYAGRCEQCQMMKAPITGELIRIINERAGIERAHLDRMPDERLRDPVMGVEWDDGTVTIVDGNHRLMKLHQRGIALVNMYLFKNPFWRTFLQEMSGGQEFLHDHYGEALGKTAS